MKKIVILLMCVFCFVGCSSFTMGQEFLLKAKKELSKQTSIITGQRMLLKARRALSKQTRIIYFNGFENDIIHLLDIEDGEEKYYYYHNGSEEFSGDRYVESLRNKKTVEDVAAESALIKQEVDLLTALLYGNLKLTEVSEHKFSNSRLIHYSYQIPSEIKQKHQLQGNYQVEIVMQNKQLINIQLEKQESDSNREYSLCILIGSPSIMDVN